MLSGQTSFAFPHLVNETLVERDVALELGDAPRRDDAPQLLVLLLQQATLGHQALSRLTATHRRHSGMF